MTRASVHVFTTVLGHIVACGGRIFVVVASRIIGLLCYFMARKKLETALDFPCVIPSQSVAADRQTMRAPRDYVWRQRLWANGLCGALRGGVSLVRISLAENTGSKAAGKITRREVRLPHRNPKARSRYAPGLCLSGVRSGVASEDRQFGLGELRR